MKKRVVNPYLPSYEYVPDGEPHVFDGRLYISGSHDRFGSKSFCANDYTCWSAPCDAVIRSISCGLGELCKMYGGMYLIDMTTYGPVYDQKMRAYFALGFHPNAMGYHAYALMIGNYIDYIIRSNPALFAEVPFIGTDLKYNK